MNAHIKKDTHMTLVERAYNFAKEKHEGQFRRDGITPYFEHCKKVASLVKYDEEKIVAYCHDLLEDKRCTEKELRAVLDNNAVYYLTGPYNTTYTNMILELTHNDNENYYDYIKRICCDYEIRELVIRVKIADIVSNLSDNPTQKQIEKYNTALNILTNTHYRH